MRVLEVLIHRLPANSANGLRCQYFLLVSFKRKSVGTVLIRSVPFRRQFLLTTFSRYTDGGRGIFEIRSFLLL